MPTSWPGGTRSRKSVGREECGMELYDRSEIEKGIAAFLVPGQLYELRAPKYADGKRRGTASGFFDDPVVLEKALVATSGHAPGVYVSINPVKPEVVRVKNRLACPVRSTAGDSHIAHRDSLLIDCDPVRVPGHDLDCATDQEKAEARTVADATAVFLGQLGWPAPAVVDSGNGYQLRYRIDLPTGQESLQLVSRCLRALASRFDTKTASIDSSVKNAARVCKFPGTLNAKGPGTAERPHRLARLLSAGDGTVVPKERLEALAAMVPAAPSVASTGKGTASDSDLGRLLAEWKKIEPEFEFEFVAEKEEKDGYTKEHVHNLPRDAGRMAGRQQPRLQRAWQLVPDIPAGRAHLLLLPAPARVLRRR